jgi:anti-repressor protein
MNELIKITEENGNQVVSARELYRFLESKADFTDWCKRMFEYGFEEDRDFTTILWKSTGGRPSVDYALSLDTAKEIAMLQRTEKGKQARLYFIECEKKLKEAFKVPQTLSEALILAGELALQKEKANQQLLEAKNTITELEPKRIFADAVSASKTTILVGELAKILKQNGIDMGQNRLFAWLREKGYLISRKGTDFNMPTQKAMNSEFFEIKETIIAHSDGHTSISKTAKVTGKGQNYFINRFLGRSNDFLINEFQVN